MIRIELPTPADVSVSSLKWACGLLAEAPSSLVVHHTDLIRAGLVVMNIPGLYLWVGVDLGFSEDEWLLRGEMREIHSEGTDS